MIDLPKIDKGVPLPKTPPTKTQVKRNFLNRLEPGDSFECDWEDWQAWLVAIRDVGSKSEKRFKGVKADYRIWRIK